MSEQSKDPLDYLKGLWGNMGFSLPGMVTPTLDTEELEKRITDLKTVEGWLRMNLSMLQMTIQSLEMQRATLQAVKAMGSMAAAQADGATEGGQAAQMFSQAAMWPWNMMSQLQAQMQEAASPAPENNVAPEAPKTEKAPAEKRPKTK